MSHNNDDGLVLTSPLKTHTHTHEHTGDLSTNPSENYVLPNPLPGFKWDNIYLFSSRAYM